MSDNKIKICVDSPTIINDVHESILRSYSQLKLLRDMVNRWDSKETINLVMDYIDWEE